MSKKYILETDYEIPFDKDIKYITFDLKECKKKNNLYLFDESAAEQRGAEKAWKLAQRIGKSPLFGGMLSTELRECFGSGRVADVIDMPYAEAAEKYELWQKKKTADDEKKVGDVVSKADGTNAYIITRINNNWINLIGADGRTFCGDSKEFKKIGTFLPEVAELLKKIGGKEE